MLPLTLASLLIVSASDDAALKQMDALYCELHQSPELSHHEEKTAAKLAERLRKLGYRVTEHIGGTGIVAILENGRGPTVLLRTDMDALPVEEKTGLSYASHVQTKDDAGQNVGVMHACGHDLHMAMWIGAATLLANDRKSWSGTLMLVGQPAEERGEGARGMIKDGLLTKFKRPDYAIALHDTNSLPSTQVGFVPGYICANVDTVDITFHGRGGHGAMPHMTVDPIVIGAHFVANVQTLVSRENDPFDPAVITVGSFHAGTKSNIIPDDAKLALTVRSYKADVRKRLLSGIERIAKDEAEAANAPKPPEVKVSESLNATYNDPKLTERLRAAVTRALGQDAVTDGHAVMGAEDFSELGLAGIPSMLLWVGAAKPEAFEASKSGTTPLPSAHSPLFAPDKDRSLPLGIHAYLAMVRELAPPSGQSGSVPAP